MTTKAAQDFEQARAMFPDSNAEDLIEAVFYAAATGGSLKEYAEKREKDAANLKKLEKFMGMYEVAEMLLDLTSPEVVQTALERVEAGREGTIRAAMSKVEISPTEEEFEEVEYEDALLAAFEARDDDAFQAIMEKIKHRRKLGLHRAKVSDSRSPVNKMHRSFNDIANEPLKVFKAITREGNEFIVDPDAPAINENAANVLRAAALRKNGSLAGKVIARVQSARKTGITHAQASIAGKGSPSAQSVKAMLGSAWADPASSDDVPALAPADVNTKHALADWQSVKITPTVDASFGAAAKSIKRPVASTNGVPNPEANAQGDVADRYWPHPKANATAANVPASSTYSQSGMKTSEQQPYDVSTRKLLSDRSKRTLKNNANPNR